MRLGSILPIAIYTAINASTSVAGPLPLARLLPGHEKRVEVALRRLQRDMQISPVTLQAIAYTESSYNPLARSTAGAHGLMQIMPAHIGTSLCPEASSKRDLEDPVISLTCGARILRYELDKEGDNLTLALARYNGGPRCVKNGEIVCKQAKIYAVKVLFLITKLLWGADEKGAK